LSACPSITFVYFIEMSEHIHDIFLPSGSATILAFLYQTQWHYSDENPLVRHPMQVGYENIAIFGNGPLTVER